MILRGTITFIANAPKRVLSSYGTFIGGALLTTIIVSAQSIHFMATLYILLSFKAENRERQFDST